MARLRLGVIGSGDVVFRFYLPALAGQSARVELVGVSDGRLEAAERAASEVRSWSPDVRAFDSTEGLLSAARPQAVVNLTPAPAHAPVTSECLRAGAHVFSEKPLAGSMAEADALIEEARRNRLTLLCAPASALTRQVRWLAELVASGELGRPTLASAQVASMGPAAWAEYTGDPTVHYSRDVGPVADLGIYRLHELTAILGPARSVQAAGSIAIPRRTIVAGPRAGGEVEVTAPDHVLIDMEFAGGALGRLMASFATPASLAPWLEIQLTEGAISLSRGEHSNDGPVSVFRDGEWRHGLTIPGPPDPLPVVGLGIPHFVDCIEGQAAPVLTAEHGRHVLELILAAEQSIADGRRHALSTSF